MKFLIALFFSLCATAAVKPAKVQDEPKVTIAKTQLRILQRTEACRTLCIREGSDDGDYIDDKKSCRCMDIKNYEEFYSRSMSLGYRHPDLVAPFTNQRTRGGRVYYDPDPDYGPQED